MSDLISRQEVKEILRTEWVKLFPMELDPYLSLAMEKIENIPSAEPKKGRWVGANEYAKHLTEETGEVYTVSSMGIDRLFCNQCWKPGGKLKTNYCPRCGAKMEATE